MPAPPPRISRSLTEIHLIDNYAHLLWAAADLMGRPAAGCERRIAFIDDRLPLDPDRMAAIANLADAEVITVSDHQAIEEFARLPRWMPNIVRRNITWASRPVTPLSWCPDWLPGGGIEVGYVYHPGFFLSKVVAGRADHVVMRDSGFANYVRHRVPLFKAVLRLAVGRSPRYQVWGEEPWIDEIEVAQPDRLPEPARSKAHRLTADTLMSNISGDGARRLALTLWGDDPVPELSSRPTALLLTQPLDMIGMASTTEKSDLYQELSAEIDRAGYDLVVKHHPRDTTPVLADKPTIPAHFPVEAWRWLDRRPFDLAVALNSTSLAAGDQSVAAQIIQLVEPTRFYPRYWPDWSPSVCDSLSTLIAPAARITPNDQRS